MSSKLKEFAKQFALWTPVALHIKSNYFCIQKVAGSSMQPTLNPGDAQSSDYVLCELLSGAYHWYQPGDVVVLSSPYHHNVKLVKRLVALQGQKLNVAGAYEAVTISQGHCWVEGDNPDSSQDSKTKFGSVPMALIQGTVKAVVWPPSRAGWIEPTTSFTSTVVLQH